jgi:hypothetical protein
MTGVVAQHDATTAASGGAIRSLFTFWRAGLYWLNATASRGWGHGAGADLITSGLARRRQP